MNPLKWPARAFVAVVDWLTGLHSTANDRINAATADLRCPWCHLDTCYGDECRDAVGLLVVTAALMREQHGPDHVRHEFWSRLADWLDFAITVPHHDLCPAATDLCSCNRGQQIARALAAAKVYRSRP